MGCAVTYFNEYEPVVLCGDVYNKEGNLVVNVSSKSRDPDYFPHPALFPITSMFQGRRETQISSVRSLEQDTILLSSNQRGYQLCYHCTIIYYVTHNK